MEKHHQFIQAKLAQATTSNRLRTLKTPPKDNIDFFSNDYLGYATKGLLAQHTSLPTPSHWSGATGSRLISGNHPEMEQLERDVAQLLDSPSALLYNSGYMANTGLLSALGEKDSVFIFDEHVHASIKEGMRLGFGQKAAFQHNDLEDLEKKLTFHCKQDKRLFVLTEGLFSMHGDVPDVAQMLRICEKYNAALIIDDAHSLGTLGDENKGISYRFAQHPNLWARVITFGKAAGAHGAMVLGTESLRNFLINFSRAFIYTTAPSRDQVNSIRAALDLFDSKTNFPALKNAVTTYLELTGTLTSQFSNNQSPIQYWLCSDVPLLKEKVTQLQKSGINCYPILSPTVKTGEERIRIVLHAFNTKEEISKLINILNA
ncbi:pyridoxal phosphate-dependent aminotransferase family protein [Echinicola soli]|uniref:Pyridoxal phosphate-dependent aminotransferase family protein n=1 Tax=Echinicola soli TaxID=2591634 RepID=A0A514CCP6_9BACT|nr:pyridoxal phosphate-dependent aminotransferase family protein [Echinicola soli]QDH77592.1 pyridoxal phosphate-dependent aminotransferase family protein [Echinicola soli]